MSHPQDVVLAISFTDAEHDGSAEAVMSRVLARLRLGCKSSSRRCLMFVHNKRLMYTVRVSEPNPRLATLMLEQFGGPDGELAAAMRYFTQAISEDDAKRKDMLLDIATEELSHLEVIGSIVAMLSKGVKAKAEGTLEQGELMRDVFHGGESHTLSILYGGGASLINSAGVPWTAAYIDTRGEPTADLRSNIAAESRAKIIYERLITVTDDPGVKEALGFLMTREVAHQKAFEKALYAIEPNFLRANCRECRSTRTSTTTCRTGRVMGEAPGTKARSGSLSPIRSSRRRWTAARAMHS